MAQDFIEKYAFSMLLFQLSLVLIGLTGVFPFSLQIAGFDVYGDIETTMNSVQTTYEQLGEGGIFSSVAITGIMLFMGVKILLEFVIMVFVGTYPIMTASGLPAAFALPISLFFGAVAVYGLGKKLLGR